ncbi:hypothetical protein D9M70_577450 [compost metagenome]
MTITPVALVVTLVVLSLRLLPVFNNLQGFFLGVVCYFASQLPPTFGAFVELAMALALGVFAGLLASLVQKRWGGQKRQTGDVSIALP